MPVTSLWSTCSCAHVCTSDTWAFHTLALADYHSIWHLKFLCLPWWITTSSHGAAFVCPSSEAAVHQLCSLIWFGNSTYFTRISKRPHVGSLCDSWKNTTQLTRNHVGNSKTKCVLSSTSLFEHVVVNAISWSGHSLSEMQFSANPPVWIEWTGQAVPEFRSKKLWLRIWSCCMSVYNLFC